MYFLYQINFTLHHILECLYIICNLAKRKFEQSSNHQRYTRPHFQELYLSLEETR